MLPTTDMMVEAAQVAYDEAAAEAGRVTRELTAALDSRGLRGDLVDQLAARSMVAIAEREYAWSVLVSVRKDRRVSA